MREFGVFVIVYYKKVKMAEEKKVNDSPLTTVYDIIIFSKFICSVEFCCVGEFG